MALTKYRLGELIELCDERNAELKYTLDDVNEIEIVEKQEDYIILHLINKLYDSKLIVKRIKIYN